MPYTRNEIPDEKPPFSGMFKPFMHPVDFFLRNMEPPPVLSDKKRATSAADTIRDGDAADTAQKC